MNAVPPALAQNPGDDDRTLLITQDGQQTDDRRTEVGNQCILSRKGGAAKTAQFALRNHNVGLQELQTSKNTRFGPPCTV